MKHIRLFSTVNERTSVVNDHPYDNILSYTKENDGILISRSMPNDEIWYTSTNNSVITPYSSNVFGANIVSNTYVNGKGVIKFDGPVTAVGNKAFYNSRRTYLKSIIIPNSVTTIGNYAFYRCTYLVSVIIPNSVTTIGNYAFQYCNTLTSVTIPNHVTSIGQYAFQFCEALTSVNIPDSVTSIGQYAFNLCSNLASVTIGSGVTSISIGAFDTCSSLTSVNIPSSVTVINGMAFQKCTGLISVNIPDSVTTIEYVAFAGCTKLVSIDIPSSVTTIGDNAFNDIINVNYNGTATGSPWGAWYINSYSEDGLLWYADNTKTVLVGVSKAISGSLTIPDGVTIIGDRAFNACSDLTSVNIPNSVTSIGTYAFNACSGLTSVNIPNSVTTIGDHVFNACSGLTSVNIPNSVTTIGDSAFRGVINVNYNGTATGSPWGARCVNGYIEDGIIYTDNTKTTLVRALPSISGGFNIPNSVTSIIAGAFYNCTGLTSVTIPDSITSISSQAFRSCTGLTSVNIPSSVTSIGNMAFYNCTALTSIICEPPTPPTLESIDVFNDTNNCPIYVPTESVDTYKAATVWMMISPRIQAIQS